MASEVLRDLASQNSGTLCATIQPGPAGASGPGVPLAELEPQGAEKLARRTCRANSVLSLGLAPKPAVLGPIFAQKSTSSWKEREINTVENQKREVSGFYTQNNHLKVRFRDQR